MTSIENYGEQSKWHNFFPVLMEKEMLTRIQQPGKNTFQTLKNFKIFSDEGKLG